MVFHEIYGKYYQTVTKILRRACEEGSISRREIRRIVSESAFSESTMYIPDAMEDNWFLLSEGGEPVLKHSPSCPLTTTEKRWLKAILQDPRIRLFGPEERGLEDVEPLFTQDMLCWFDRYADGDPYEDPVYLQNFRTLLQAIARKRKVAIQHSGSGVGQCHTCIPHRLEYSEKDDKFRLLAIEKGKPVILNLAKMQSCRLLEQVDSPRQLPPLQKTKLVLELQDRRNALERAMLHFSHLEKETEQLEKGLYRITLWYEPRDERELLIRILSFGPMVKVTAPERMVSQLRERITKQNHLRTP